MQVVENRDLLIAANSSDIFVSNQPLINYKSSDKKEICHISPVDLSDFPCTANELRQLEELFCLHEDVFVKSDDDLGCTDAVQHCIRTTDDNPVDSRCS